ncbi:hypothetical protein [Pseudomonas sp.]|uniref:hypothetical protein n=1 Tax=Pseudomonas sp. TaxID=306 RepID=UPI003FD76F12
MMPIHKAIGVLLLPIVVLISDHALAENQDCVKSFELVKSQGNDDFIALPHTGIELNSMHDTHQICYRGEDVTRWAAGAGMDVTSGVNGVFKNGSVAFVTAHQRLKNGKDYSAGGYRSALILLRADERTQHLTRVVLMTQQPDADPRKSIDDFHITGYDTFNKIVYFQTPAWATSDAIYSFPLTQAIQGEKPKLKYLGPGNIDTVMNDLGFSDSSKYIGNLLVSRHEPVPGGRVNEVMYLEDADGKQICRVDTTKLYRLKPDCI